MDSPTTTYNGVDKTSTLIVQPTLQTLTNKRLQSETTYTINELMDSSTRDNCWGITKDSTLIVDIPEPVYPEITFNTIEINGAYTLQQLTNNQSNAFDSNSIINVVVLNKTTIKKILYNGSELLGFYKNTSSSNKTLYISSLTQSNIDLISVVDDTLNNRYVFDVYHNVSSSASFTIRSNCYYGYQQLSGSTDRINLQDENGVSIVSASSNNSGVADTTADIEVILKKTNFVFDQTYQVMP